MTTIYKYNGRTLRLGKAWTDDAGIQHPRNWGLWSAEQKQAKGITEVVLQPFPNTHLYRSSHNEDGSVSSTARDIDEVKAHFKAQVSTGLANYLSQSDWYYIRKMDKETAIPSAVQTWRDELRANATSMESAINEAADVTAIEALISNGSLSTWSEYEDVVAAAAAAAEAAAAEAAAAEAAAAEAAAEAAAAEAAAAEAAAEEETTEEVSG